LHALIGAGLMNLGQFVALIMIGKFGTPDLLGQYGWCVSVAGPVVIFCMLGMRAVLIADSANRRRFGSYRAARNVAMAAAGVILAIVVTIRGLRQADLFFVLIFAGVAATRIIDGVGEIHWGLAQKDERMDAVALAGGWRGVVMIAAFLLGPPLAWRMVRAGALSDSQLGLGPALALGITAIGWIAVVVLVDVRFARRTRHYDPAWTWREVRAVLWTALPLGVVALLISLSASIPRWIIEAAHGERGFRYLGFFAALSTIIVAGNLLIVQLGHTAANRLALFYREDLPRFLRLLLRLEVFCVLLGAGALLLAWRFGEWLLAALFRPEYADYHREFMIIVLAQCVMFISSILGFAATQMQVYWLQVVVWTGLCGVAWGVSAWRIPADPIGGGAEAMLAVALAQLVAYAGAVVYGVRRRTALLKSEASRDGR
jgi:hypothetical protein